jgi:hypothetical protein
MLGFDKFTEEGFIKESLDSPIEFYMTDDTKMPKEIYAAIEHDGVQYGMSLILSEYDNVYTLDFYRIVSVKKRFWSFYKPNHIRPMLSTVIKFMEACYPFVQVKMKGILIDLPGKAGSERYVSLLGRILKKSYIKQFREVPVVKTTDKAKNYLFLVRKGVEPTNLFKTAAFHKNFKFDGKEKPVFTSDIMDDAKGYYKTLKPTVSIKPSEKFAFGKVKVELSADDETVYMLDKASAEYKAGISSPKKKEEETKKEYVVSINKEWAKNIIQDAASQGSSPAATSGYFDNVQDSVYTISFPHLLAKMLPNAYDKISKFGYDESKINFNDLNYAIKQGYNSLPQKVRSALVDEGIFKVNGELNITPENEELVKTSLATFMYIPATSVTIVSTIMNTKMAETKKNIPKSASAVEKKLELDKNPVSVVEAFATSNESSPYSGDLGFIESGEDVPAKKKALISMPEIGKWYKSLKLTEYSGNADDPEQNSLWSYTGSTASYFNQNLRGMISSKKLSKKDLVNYGDVSVETLIRYFDKAPVLENGIWVYRNADTPNVDKYDVGDDYIDAAFMSTSIRSTMTLSSGGNTRLKIYVPKGTKVFPILDKSSHPDENEIVLPPMSILRITETYDKVTPYSDKRLFVCTMIGTGYKSFMEAMEQELILEQTKKTPKKEQYNPEDKWGAPTSSYEDAQKIKKLIEQGKIKIRK